MKKRTTKTTFASIIVLICIVGLAYSCFKIFKWKINVDGNAKIKEQLSKSIKVKDNDYLVDFNTLKELNEDVVAYLKVNNTNIDYVVVRGNDNEYYLNHNFDKKYNESGWIYADYRNLFDDTDQNIIIYGHNTRNGSMFGSLKQVLNKKWCEKANDHQIVLVTEKGTYYYQIFSSYLIESEDYYIDTFFKTDSEFINFINELRARSIYNYGITVDKDDKIITLSSCTHDGKKRVVLHAKLVQ